MGDVAGIGPEVIVRAWQDARLHRWSAPVVVGHPAIIERAIELVGARCQAVAVGEIASAEPTAARIPCWNPGSDEVVEIAPGSIDGRAGRAAYEYLIGAASAALDGKVDAITTAPLNKAALRMAGLDYPGHTEILAKQCGVENFAMMLYMPPGDNVVSGHGLGVAHVTLHTSIASVPGLLNEQGIREKIGLVGDFMRRMGCRKPRIGVCALNPHAGEQGLFGDEESRLIAPAVEAARAAGGNIQGPYPADTLMQRACSGEFDGIVAMYHDQGHIALKLLGFERAVNVTLGLPIVRTSPSHGTGFDIAWQGSARPDGFLEAVHVAALLAKSGHAG